MTEPRAAGRPQEGRVTVALLEATLAELSEAGYERTTIATIAARAKTSKQAVYRRYPDKVHLVASAVETALARVEPAPPQRGSVADDLRHFLTGMVDAFPRRRRSAVPFGRWFP